MTHLIDPPSEHPTYGIPDAARHLGVGEPVLLGWLAAFNWERRYDHHGALQLGERDLEFLRVIRSLREIDRSCESIVRLLAEDPDGVPFHATPEEAEEAAAAAEQAAAEAEEAEANLAQIETLKAELKDLHARPRRSAPFWQFWKRDP